MRRALLVLPLLLVAACGGDAGGSARPAHLLDLRPAVIERVDVTEPATGRTGGGAPPAGLARDLSPLLAVRELDRRLPDYGLDPPRLVVTVHAGVRRVRLLVGADNFDGTAVYVAVGGRTALVLPRVASALEALLPADQ